MFTSKYPYTDTQELNLDWILGEVKRLQERIDEFETTVLDEAKAYVDSQIVRFDVALNNFENQVNETISILSSDIDDFETSITNIVNNLSDDIDSWEARLEADIAAVNYRTDLRIEQNNNWILEYLGEELRSVKIIDYFTGEEISVQDMFDKLAQFHLADPLTYTMLATKNKTYAELAAYAMTYTQFINSGNVIIT